MQRTRYPQSALNGQRPINDASCRQPCTGKFGNHHQQRKLFGFWKPQHALPCVVKRIKI
jgi:hypothetical protein